MTRPRWLSTALAWLGSLVAVLLLILWLAGAFEDKIEAGKARRVRTTVGPDARLATVTLTVEPVIEEAAGVGEAKTGYVVYMSPQGKQLTHQMVRDFTRREHLVILCGRYEGVDERALEGWVDEEVSIGDYVVSGGELPAMVLTDAVARLIPGVLGNEESAKMDSFFYGLLDYPHYTRPAEFRGWRAPEVLVSGHHGEVAKWRRRAALLKTFKMRPDLIEKATLTDEERRWLDEVIREGC